jgi:transposase-like protein
VKKKRVSVEQITLVLRQVQRGVPVSDVCRQVGMSEQTFYRWKKVYGRLPPSEAREMVKATRSSAYYASRKDPLTAFRQRVRELAQTAVHPAGPRRARCSTPGKLTHHLLIDPNHLDGYD